jgi:hypothetical protein
MSALAGSVGGDLTTSVNAVRATPFDTLEDTMTNTSTKTTGVRVRLSLPVGLNEKGKETRAYVQQIAGANPHKVATISQNGSVQVYDWIIRNAGKPEETAKGGDGVAVKLPAANFSKVGRTESDETGLYRVKFELGDGIYRVVRPNLEKRNADNRFTGWPETVFVKVAGGQTMTIDQNAARAAFGLAPVVIASKGKTYIADDDTDISV